MSLDLPENQGTTPNEQEKDDEEETSASSGSGAGCASGFAALSMLGALALFMHKKF